MKLELINETIVTEANWYKKKKYEDVEQLLKDFAKDHQKDLDRWFISFTSIEKLGINPGSTFNTPLGIYSYPLRYVIDFDFITNLPFVGNQPFINLFKIKNNLVILTSSDTASEYMAKLNRYIPGVFDAHNDEIKKYQIRSNISQLWLYTKLASDHDPKRWGYLLKKLGIDGIVDRETSTIHPSEPTQAVFFSTNVIEKNVRLMNKDVKFDKETGEYTKAKDAKDYASDKIQSLIMSTVKKNDLEKLDEILKDHDKYPFDASEIANKIISHISNNKKYDDLPSIVKIFKDNTEGYLGVPLLIKVDSKDTDDPQLFMKILQIFNNYDDFIDNIDNEIIKMATDGADSTPNTFKYLLYSEETKDEVDLNYLWVVFRSKFKGLYRSESGMYDILHKYFIDRGLISKNDVDDYLDEIVKVLSSGTRSPAVYFKTTMDDISAKNKHLNIPYNKFVAAIIDGLVKNPGYIRKYNLRKKIAEISETYGIDKALIAYGPFAISNDIDGFKIMYEKMAETSIYSEFREYARKHANQEFNSYLESLTIEQTPYEQQDYSEYNGLKF